MNKIIELIKKLPKAELHLHIEGTLEPELMFKLAKRNKISIPFESVEEVKFAYNLNELSLFYNLYRDLMNHWIAIWPNSIIDIKYEKIIENPEQQIRYLVKACNLKWNDDCMTFYKNKRYVTTASLVQVRKPIYKKT